MAELIEITYDVEHGGRWRQTLPGETGQLRVPKLRWTAYDAAWVKLVSAQAALRAAGQEPVYVTPDQEAAIRAVAKEGSWIVVQEQTAQISPEVVTGNGAEQSGTDQPAPSAPAPPPGPPQRPPMGPCAARGGLPHGSMRYAYTDAASVYFPGLKRVDGICQCGMRLADVQCPHMKQSNDDERGPRCRNCGKMLVGNAQVIDNRNLAGRAIGAPDPNVHVPVPPGSTEAPSDAYRAPA